MCVCAYFISSEPKILVELSELICLYASIHIQLLCKSVRVCVCECWGLPFVCLLFFLADSAARSAHRPRPLAPQAVFVWSEWNFQGRLFVCLCACAVCVLDNSHEFFCHIGYRFSYLLYSQTMSLGKRFAYLSNNLSMYVVSFTWECAVNWLISFYFLLSLIVISN